MMTVFKESNLYDNQDSRTYKMQVIFLDTGSPHVRPPQEVLDYLIQKKNMVGLSACIVAERMLSYAGDIPLEVVASRPDTSYARFSRRTVSDELDRMITGNIGGSNSYWKRRLIDVHRTADYNTFPGLVIFGIKILSNDTSILDLISDHGAQCVFIGSDRSKANPDIRYSAYIDPTHCNYASGYELILNSVLAEDKQMDVRPVYASQPEYTAELEVLAADLKNQVEGEKK